MTNNYKNHPWFGDSLDDEKEKLKNFFVNEDYGTNTRCKILYNRGANIHFIYISTRASKIFASYKDLKQSLPIYWLLVDGKLYLSFKEPTSGVYYKTRAQLANTNTTPRYKITIPSKVIKSFQLQTHCIVNLIQKEDVYLCSFDYKNTGNYE